MTTKTTTGLFAVLALALLVAACPNDSVTPEPNESGPKFTGLSISGSKILVIFDKTLSGTPDAAKITVRKGEATLTYGQKEDYTLSIEGKNLVITLKTAPITGEQYTVELLAGTVKDASGKSSEAPASSAKTTLTVGIPPAIHGSLTFKADSNTVLELDFNTPVAIVESAKIKVETKATTAEAKFTAVDATIKVNESDSTKLEITLDSVATDGDAYRVRVEVGGIRATTSGGLVNSTELNSTEVIYSISPVLNTAIPPYILGNTIIATFSQQIAIKSGVKVKVQKKTTADDDFASFAPTGTTVDTSGKTRLKITLPAIANGNVYRLALEAGAINQDGNADNENKAITPTNLDITIEPAPTLATDAVPIFENTTEFSVSFQADVALLNAATIKVESQKGADEYETVLGQSIAVDSTDPKKINFILSQAVDGGQTWKVTFPVESVITPGRVANTDALTTNEAKTTPIIQGSLAFKTDSSTVLELGFDIPVAIAESDRIKVETKALGAEFEAVNATSKVSESDNTKLDLTLGSAAINGNIYRIKVEAGGVRSTESQLVNGTELSSSEIEYLLIPALDPTNPPYSLEKKIIITFNQQIAIKDWRKVNLYLLDLTSGDFVLKQSGKDEIAVNKTLLEITTNAINNREIYRIALKAGAVNHDGKSYNENKAIIPKDLDIIIGPAVALDSDNNPYLSGQSIIVPLNARIVILDAAKIKYQFKANAGIGNFDSLITPTTTPSVLNKTNLVIPLNQALVKDQVYRISLTSGAISGKNRAPGIGSNIEPTDKDMTVSEPTLNNVNPIFANKKKLSVIFPASVALRDARVIKVEKKDNGKTFETVIGHSAAVDDTDTRKINITLPQEAAFYTQAWKVTFPISSVESSTGIANTAELTTGEGILRFTDAYNWTEVTTGTKWSPRRGFASVVFDDGDGEKIWVFGGSDDANSLNDVWHSTDGSTWTENEPPGGAAKKTSGSSRNWWVPRRDFTSVVFDDGDGEKIWVLGGSDDTDLLNDVWHSTDGSIWIESKLPGDAAKETGGATPNWWVPRRNFSSVVFDDGNGEKIWVLGGYDNTNSLNDVWHSTNGSTWTEALPTGGKVTSGQNPNWWPARSGHSSVVFKDKIWVIGGIGTTAWHSANGNSWDEVANIKAALGIQASVVYNGRIWNMDSDVVNLNIVNSILSNSNPANAWITERKPDWREGATSIGFAGVVFQNKIWIWGGGGATKFTLYDDIWTFGPITE